MGKAKKKFIEKQSAVKFKLVYRSSEDPNNTDDTLADRVFKVIDDKKSEKINEETKSKKDKILSQFQDYDLGKFDAPKLKKPIEDDQYMQDEVKNRDDLWINHIYKKKEQEKQKIIEDNEGEEWEDEEMEEIDEEFDSENYEDEKEEEKSLKKEEIINLKNDKNGKEIEIEIKDKMAEKIYKMNDPINIKEKFDVNPDVKMKYYDDNGLLIDGYDYYQHIAKDDSEGIIAAVYNAVYEKPPDLAPDYDYDPEQMDPEQKEVFEALQYEGKDTEYENLEDDFVRLANCGEDVLKEKEIKIPEKKENQEKTLKDDIKKFINGKDKKSLDKKIDKQIEQKKFKQVAKEYDSDEEDLPQMPECLSKQDFKKIVGEYIKHMQKREEKKTGMKVLDTSSEEEVSEDEDPKTVPHPGIDDSEVIHKKVYERLAPEEDYALQTYLNKSTSSEIDQNNSDKEAEEESDGERIIIQTGDGIKTKPQQPVSLNIVKEESKRIKKIKENTEETNSKITDLNKKNTHVEEIFKKREKNETKEEKKIRKENIKKFKEERKEKKKIFKAEFTKQKHIELKKENKTIAANNIEHVSKYKII